MTKSRKSLGTDLSALLGVANDNAQFATEAYARRSEL